MNRIGALPKDIKQKNDMEILRSLADLESFTVQDIANRTKISRLTITRALERFMEKGIVVQSGKGSSTSLGGKKPQEYILNPNRYAISIAPSKGKTQCTLMSFDGNEIDLKEFPFPSNMAYPQFIKNAAACIRDLLKDNKIKEEEFYGMLLCSGGIIDPKEGVFTVSSIPEWGNDLHAAEDLRKELGKDYHIESENVSKVCSGMLRFNSDVLGKRVAVMYADYGISITLLEDGKTPDTVNNVNGELGHMCLDPNDEETCVCGSKGCFELLVSQARIFKMIDALSAEEKAEMLKDYDGKEDVRIYLLNRQGKADAKTDELCAYMAKYVGLAFRNVVLGFDPDLFVIQGVFSYGSKAFFDQVISKIRENKYLQDIQIEIRKENRELSQMLKKGSMNIILSSILEA